MLRVTIDADWWLLSQQEHARLAEVLTRLIDWHPAVPDELLAQWRQVVLHHDDGWEAWDSSPGMNDLGEPRAFDEMEFQDAAPIWERSIAVCCELSLWGGLWVSRHFCYLAENWLPRMTGNVAPLARRFLNQQDVAQQQWRREASTHYSPVQIKDYEEYGYRALQFFDRFSLWMCLAPPKATAHWTLPDQQPFEIVQQSPRFFRVPALAIPEQSTEVEATALRMPAQRLGGVEAWQQAWSHARRDTLTFHLLAAHHS